MSLAPNPLAGGKAAAKDADTDVVRTHKLEAAVIQGGVGIGNLVGRWYDMPDQDENVNASGTVNGMQAIIDAPDCIGIRITKDSFVRNNGGDVWLMGLPAPSPLADAAGSFSGSARPRKTIKLFLESHHTSTGRMFLTGPGAGFGIPFWTDIHRRGTGAPIGVQYNPIVPGDVLEFVFEPAADAAAEALYPGTWMAVTKTTQIQARSYNFLYSPVVTSGGTPGTGFTFANSLSGSPYRLTFEARDNACRVFAFGEIVFFNMMLTLTAYDSNIFYLTNDCNFSMANTVPLGLKDQMLLYRTVFEPPGSGSGDSVGSWQDVLSTFGTTAGTVFAKSSTAGTLTGIRFTLPAHSNGLQRVLHVVAVCGQRMVNVAL